MNSKGLAGIKDRTLQLQGKPNDQVQKGTQLWESILLRFQMQ